MIMYVTFLGLQLTAKGHKKTFAVFLLIVWSSFLNFVVLVFTYR